MTKCNSLILVRLKELMGGNRNSAVQQNETDKLYFSEELHGYIKKFIDCSHGKKNKFISSNYKGNVKPGIFSIDFSIIVRASPHKNILPINLLP